MAAFQSKTFHSLESLRFIASAVIVLFHFSWYFEKRFLFKGFLAVDLFFVLSGFVITYSYSTHIENFRSYCIFIGKRLARLYPLHLLTLSIYVLVGIAAISGALTVINPDKYRLSALLCNVTLTQAWGFSSGDSFNTVSWSISAEFVAYLLFPCVLFFMRRRFAVGTSILALIYAASLYLCHRMFNVTLPELAWHFGFLRALPSFALGAWLFVNLEQLSSMFSDWMAVICFWASSIWWVASMTLSLNDYEGLAAASFVVIFAVIAEHRGLLNYVCHPWLSRRGELTFSIYMLHPLMATVVISAVAPKVLGRSPGALVLALLVAIALTYVLAKLSYKYFETPARKWLMRTPRRPGATLEMSIDVRS